MANELLVTVHLPSTSGLPEDEVVQSFVMKHDGAYNPLVDDALTIAPAIEALYNSDPAGATAPLSFYLSGRLVRTLLACSFKVYDIEGHLHGSPHGSPVGGGLWTLGASGSAQPVPDEVAIVATIRGSGALAAPVEVPDGADANALPDRPRQRLTGRTYFGPFNQGAVFATVDGGGCRPAGGVREAIGLGIVAMQAEIEGDGWPGLHVWSRANANTVAATSVEVDDAWDTMRSRGVRPSARQSWAL